MARKQIVPKIVNKELVKEKHKRIVDAASGLFLKKGFHKTTMRDIAKKSKIELSYLYKYISTKDDILYLFYEHVTNQYEPRYRMIESSQDEEPLMLMQKALLLILEAIHGRLHEVHTMYTESRHLKHDSLCAVLERESEFVKIIESLIRRGIKSGVFKVEDPVMAANIVQYMVVVESLRGWNFRGRYCFEDFAESVIDFIMGGLKVDEKKWQKIRSKKKG